RSSAIPLSYLFIRFFSSIKVYLLYYSVDIVYGVNHESFMLFLVFVGMLFYNYFFIILFFIFLLNLLFFYFLILMVYLVFLFSFFQHVNFKCIWGFFIFFILPDKRGLQNFR